MLSQALGRGMKMKTHRESVQSCRTDVSYGTNTRHKGKHRLPACLQKPERHISQKPAPYAFIKQKSERTVIRLGCVLASTTETGSNDKLRDVLKPICCLKECCFERKCPKKFCSRVESHVNSEVSVWRGRTLFLEHTRHKTSSSRVSALDDDRASHEVNRRDTECYRPSRFEH